MTIMARLFMALTYVLTMCKDDSYYPNELFIVYALAAM